jgi:putative SOS response-associated peptidase YedK
LDGGQNESSVQIATSKFVIIRNSRDTGECELVSLRWGLIPFFTKDIKEVKGISTIKETLRMASALASAPLE